MSFAPPLQIDPEDVRTEDNVGEPWHVTAVASGHITPDRRQSSMFYLMAPMTCVQITAATPRRGERKEDADEQAYSDHRWRRVYWFPSG
jgi:hypothetical protein